MSDTERWRSAREIFDAAVAVRPEARAALINGRCGDDAALRAEVESLLAADAAQGSVFDRPPAPALRERAFDAVADALQDSGCVLVPGSRFGCYEIKTFLGAGGMGEVYRAHDTMLGREIAIKIVHDLTLADVERRKRFDREARLLAALNHPNIGAIYGIEEHDGIRGLVLELVEGDTLAERLRKHVAFKGGRRGFPVREALNIASQIAQALEAAHELGIVHRDLKPANIKITPDGRVKVLDFGLAKAAADAERNWEIAGTGSKAVTATQAGAILGTAPYMSPEQARGDPIDTRTDIWAFGCVLYEMLTGKRAFGGTSATEALSRVVEADPDLRPLPADMPPVLRPLLTRCLEKDRSKRLPLVGIARFEIEEAMARSIGTGAGFPVRRPMVRALALGIIIGAIAALTFASLRTPGASLAASVSRLLVAVTPADQLGGTEGRPTRPAFAISPDGQSLVFSAVRGGQRSLYLRRFDTANATAISGTDGAESPFFSPDGRWIGYWAGGEIRKVPLGGGPSVRVSETSPLFGVSWGDDDRIVFSRASGGLWEVPAAGGTPTPLTMLHEDRGEISHRLPHVLPRGDAILFTVIRHRFPRWDQTQIFVYSRRTGATRMLIDGGADARYAPTGHILYVREGLLLATPFDLQRLEVGGGPVGLVADVMQAAYFRNRTEDVGAAQFALSSTGTLIYLQGGVFSPSASSIVSVDRNGGAVSLPITPRAFVTLRLSPDGQRMTLSTYGRDRDLWVYDQRRETLNKLAVAGRNSVPIWYRDSERITYAAGVGGVDDLSWVRADGSGSSELLVQSDDVLVPAAWMPNGQQLLYYRLPSETTTSSPWAAPSDAPWIWMHNVAVKSSPIPVAGTLANAGGVDVSPDGQWIAYHSDESGRLQVYVQAYPGPAPRYQVSRDGGISPVWRADGRELFYVRSDGRTPMGSADVHIMALPIRLQPTFNLGEPKALFAGRYDMNSPARAYDVTPDGQRFLFIQRQERPSDVITHMTVVQNWHEELRRLVPTR